MKRAILFLFVSMVVALTAILAMPWSFVAHDTSDQDYSTWMADHVHPDRRLVDVAMPGAHDAFARGYTLRSPLDQVAMDSGYGNALLNPPVGSFIKGFMIRQSTTQIGDVTSLFEAGVRYFDIRLTYDDGWHITHNYIAPVDVLEELRALRDKLESTSGEIVLLDFQWVFDARSVDFFADATTYDDLLDLIDEAGLTPYVLPASEVDLTKLTYDEAREDGSRVLLIAKTGAHPIFFDREAHLESVWHNTDSYDVLIENIAATSGDVDCFRVMQAVKTIQVDAGGVIQAIGSWSLLRRAVGFHTDLLDESDFERWVRSTPIVMSDASDINVDGFVDQLMELIIQINLTP